MHPQIVKCTFFAVIVLLLTLHQSQAAAADSMANELANCLENADYDMLLQTVQTGLPLINTTHHVAVVGAGIAGLTAAKLLRDAGHRVTILEASDHVGGRIQTYRNEDEGWYAELGAMRIPSSNKIVLWFAKEFGLKLNDFIMSDPNTFYLVNGQRERTAAVDANPDILKYDLPDNERGKSAEELLEESLKKVTDELINHGFQAMLEKYDRYSVKEYLKEAGLSSEAMRMIEDKLNKKSQMHMGLTETIYDQGYIADITTYFEITGGSDLLPKAFMNLLNELNVDIHLNSKVKRISQSDIGVTVSYQNDQSTLTDLEADVVLVTTTTKAALFMDFDPPLSIKKMEALRAAHYSSSTKVLLTFSEKFWEADGIHGGKSITDGPSRYIYYPSHSFSNETIGVLLASYTWSDDSLLFLGASDQDLKELVLRDLALIHGKDVSSLCTGVVVKKWSLDPYSLGAFALFTPYQHLEYAEELFKREGRLHFAGEHTGFPHGWIETSMKTAIRAAANINKAVKETSQATQH